jgi:hypothetical protein
VEHPPEDDVVKKLEGFYRESKDYRDGDLQMTDRWRSYRSWILSTGRDRGVFGDQTTYVNLIAEKWSKLNADVTEAMPTFNYRARGRAGLNLSEYLNMRVPQLWEQNDADQTYRETVAADHMYGTWFWKVVHDPGYGGRGPKVRLRAVPCHRMFPAPYATTIQGSPGIVENDYGIRVNPELEPQDLPDISEDLDPVRGTHRITYGTNLGGTNQVPFHDATYPSLGRQKTEGYVLQKEAWIMDPTLQAKYWIEAAQNGPEFRHGKDLAYPKGRTISWANGRRLYDHENQYSDGLFPYVRFIDSPFPEFFWGLGEIPNLINLQLLHDDMVDTMRLIHAYMANGRLIIDTTTGLRDREVGNDPGEILWTRRGTHDRIKWLPGLTPPAEFYTHVAKIEQWFDLVTGSFDVTRGVNPSGVTAARALVALQRAAGIRVRARMRENEDSLKDVGRMVASRVRQFDPTFSEVVGPDGTIVPMELSEEDRDQEVDLKVDVVTNLDDLKSAEFQKTLLFKNLGIISDERLLKESGHSAKEAFMAELPEILEARARAAAIALQNQPQGGEGRGGPVQQAADGVVGASRAVTRSLRAPIGGE